jgi:phosphoribosylformylglycinamidine synthase
MLGSAKGWAGAFKYNEKANTALKNFFKREILYLLGFVMAANFYGIRGDQSGT